MNNGYVEEEYIERRNVCVWMKEMCVYVRIKGEMCEDLHVTSPYVGPKLEWKRLRSALHWRLPADDRMRSYTSESQPTAELSFSQYCQFWFIWDGCRCNSLLLCKILKWRISCNCFLFTIIFYAKIYMITANFAVKILKNVCFISYIVNLQQKLLTNTVIKDLGMIFSYFFFDVVLNI